MEKAEQFRVDNYELASEFLLDCNDQIIALNADIRKLLRTSDRSEYFRTIEMKALYIGSLYEQANIQAAMGLDMPKEVLNHLAVISEEALDRLDAEDYHGIEQMLIKRRRVHIHAHGNIYGNMLEDEIHRQQQREKGKK